MRIFIADDEKNMTFLIKKHLESKGHQVDACANGREALEYFKNNRYDVAFLDHDMPEMTGLEVLKCIKETGNRDMKVVMFTGYPSELRELARLMGADYYLAKPYRLTDIEAVVSRFECVIDKKVNGDKSAAEQA